MHVKLEILHHPPTGAAQATPPLLFVHGAFMSAQCWQKHFLPWFAQKGFDCHAMSFRGHGNSSGREFLSLASLEHFRYDLAQTIAEMETTPILIGHGMGGLVIQQWLQEYSAPAVAMLASVPPVPGMCSMLQLAMTNPRALFDLNQLHCDSDEENLIEQLRETMFSPHTADALIRENMPFFQPESHRALIDLSVLNFQPLAPERRPSMLMIAGEKDALLPHHLVHAAAAHCGITAHTINGVGHAVMLEAQWEAAAKILLEWLETGENDKTTV